MGGTNTSYQWLLEKKAKKIETSLKEIQLIIDLCYCWHWRAMSAEQ